MSRCEGPLSEQQQQALRKTVQQISASSKGILAVDGDVESTGKRLTANHIENTEENRRLFRQILFTSDGISDYISGIILPHETFYQNCDDGTPFVKFLADLGIVAGINVDKGHVPQEGSATEVSTQGLDGLAERVTQYKKGGAAFAKWRAVYKINSDVTTPSQLSLNENANTLAQYASICQRHGLVPIVEPDISAEGVFDLETAQNVAEMVWHYVHKALIDHQVYTEGIILKPNMVIPGNQCPKIYTHEQVAKATVTALERTIPSSVPLVAFLSGGQPDEDATCRLNEINKFADKKWQYAPPWNLTFCFGRALTRIVLQTWHGKKENVQMSQDRMIRRAKANGTAAQGKYTGDTTD